MKVCKKKFTNMYIPLYAVKNYINNFKLIIILTSNSGNNKKK